MDSKQVEEALALASKVAATSQINPEDDITDEKNGNDKNDNTADNGKPDKSSNSNNSSSQGNDSPEEGEKVDFKVIFNKKKYDISFPLDADVGALKAHLQPTIEIPPAMMKVMIKGLAKDEMTLRKLGVTKGTKVMVVGSSLNDVLSVSTQPTKEQLRDTEAKSSTSGGRKEALSKDKLHKKALSKGKPEDAMAGVKNTKEKLPTIPIKGLLNKHGDKVRLTFKLEADQVWIGTKDRTEKVPLSSIKSVVNEPIEGQEEYHIVALQLGPTEASRYWLYWVPAQYVDAIKDAVFGSWPWEMLVSDGDFFLYMLFLPQNDMVIGLKKDKNLTNPAEKFNQTSSLWYVTSWKKNLCKIMWLFRKAIFCLKSGLRS